MQRMIRIILCLTVHSKLNGFKTHPVFLYYRFHRLCHNRRRVAECTAAKCAENYDFVPFCPCNFQHSAHPFFMQGLQFFPTDMYGGIAVPGVHFVAGTLPQIGRCAGQNIYRIPLFFRHQLRIIRV